LFFLNLVFSTEHNKDALHHYSSLLKKHLVNKQKVLTAASWALLQPAEELRHWVLNTFSRDTKAGAGLWSQFRCHSCSFPSLATRPLFPCS